MTLGFFSVGFFMCAFTIVNVINVIFKSIKVNMCTKPVWMFQDVSGCFGIFGDFWGYFIYLSTTPFALKSVYGTGRWPSWSEVSGRQFYTKSCLVTNWSDK
jgi:hypothetical protein